MLACTLLLGSPRKEIFVLNSWMLNREHRRIAGTKAWRSILCSLFFVFSDHHSEREKETGVSRKGWVEYIALRETVSVSLQREYDFF